MRNSRSAADEQGDVDHHGGGAHDQRPAARQALGSAHRADRRRRGAHLRHGQSVPPDRHLFAGRTAVRAGRRRLDAVLQRSEGRAAARGGHHRSRRALLLGRRRHRLQRARRRHVAVLYLLLDVRFPTRRRSDLGRGRSAYPRLPVRRDRRPHDARAAKGCSIRTAAATSSPRRCPIAAPTIPPSPTSSR